MIRENYQFHYSLIHHPGKPTILFLHGFMGNIHEFDAAIKLLGDEYSYLKLDLPGHGKTQVLGSDESYIMANTAQAIINLLNKLKIVKCFLVGYSMGGRLALYLTLYFPERFIKVILESASPGLATQTERLERINRDTKIARKLVTSAAQSDFVAFLSNWYNQPIFGSIKNHPEFYRMLESRLQNDPIELVKSLKFMGIGSQPSLWEELQNNITSLLLLTGEYDYKFININAEMAHVCKLAQLKVINNSAHNIHFENSLAFVQNIKIFFNDVERN